MSEITRIELTDRPVTQQHNGNGKRWSEPSFLLQVAAYLVAITIAYGLLTERIARLESQSDALRDAVSEIRSDVKQLLRESR